MQQEICLFSKGKKDFKKKKKADLNLFWFENEIKISKTRGPRNPGHLKGGPGDPRRRRIGGVFPPARYLGEVPSRPLALCQNGSAESAVLDVSARARTAWGDPGGCGGKPGPPAARPAPGPPYIGVLVGGDGDELSLGESECLHAAWLAGVLRAVLVHFHHMQAGLVLVQGL